MAEGPLLSRDISWLYFNERVLQEAEDPRVPLFERIKFLAIYSSNLDEFFRVRVASLRSFKQLKKKTRKSLMIKPKKELKQIRKLVQQQQNRFGRVFREEVLPQLAKEGIHLRANEDYSVRQYDFTREYFEQNVRSLLNIQSISADQSEPPFLKNRGLYFALATGEQTEEEGADRVQYWLVEIPSQQLARFIVLPPGEESRFEITFLDDIIRCHIGLCFEQAVTGVYSVKLSRDAELYIDDEFEGDLLKKLRKSLQDRNIGLPTRFLYDTRMPGELLATLRSLLGLKKDDLIPGARYHNFNDFFTFPDPLERAVLHDPPFPPLPHPELSERDSMMGAIRERDQLLCFPYQQYDYVVRLIEEAASNPQVRSIRITLYRVAGGSAVVQGLLQACKAGKTVTAFVEAKARFDEESNLFWGEELQRAGAQVFYSYPGIKVHTKLLLIEEESAGDTHYLAYLGTGNFNEKTARLYGDYALLTARQELAREVLQVFAVLERKTLIPRTEALLVAPFTLRDRFVEMVDREIELARAGKNAWMILKMNSLEDPDMIQKLYEASRAGVRIQLIVRGICCLVPGLEEWSENIEGISIVDRFLEHARVYIFGNGGREKMYLASADWMTRNLDRRVEVAFPVIDRKIAATIRKHIDLQLADNQKARILEPDWKNLHRKPRDGEKALRSQVAIYRSLKMSASKKKKKKEKADTRTEK